MKILLMYNPKSGNSKFSSKIEYIKQTLEMHNIYDVTFYESSAPNDIKNYIIKNLDNIRYDVLVISGGDGTLNEAINGLMNIQKKPKLAYLPSGTSNDVGHMLGMSKNLDDCFKEILKNNVVKIDVCQMNNNFFLYTSGCGKFTNVSYDTPKKKLKKTLGRSFYFLESIKQIPQDTTMDLTIKYDDKVITGKYFLMLALTGNRVAGFTIKRDKEIKLNNGQIELLLFTQKNFTSILNMTNYFILGDLYQNGVEKHNSNKFEILSTDKIDYNIDGEFCGKHDTVSFECHKEAIEIFVSDKSKKLYF